MPKTLVLGLDGATFDVLGPLIEDGHLPAIAELVETGASGTLRAPMPPVTSPSWLSLATGLSPGTTGIYDFIKPEFDDEYDLRFVDSSDFKGRTVWDYLGSAGVSVGIVDYPLLSPPYGVNGFMVSGGFGSSGHQSYPAALDEELDPFDKPKPHLTLDSPEYDDLGVFLDDLLTNIDRRQAILEHVLRTRSPEFCWAVIQESDWMQHLMWKCFDDSHPDADTVTEADRRRFVEFWERIDEFVATAVELVPDDTNIVLQSDHGFGPTTDTGFLLNTWLKNEGYLIPKDHYDKRYWLNKTIRSILQDVANKIRLRNWAPGLFRWGKDKTSEMMVELNAMDLDRTTAFDPGHIGTFGGIYINKAALSDQTYTELRSEIVSGLQTFASQEGLELGIHVTEQFYNTTAPNSPDILVRLPGGGIYNGDWDDGVITEKPDRLAHLNGTHRRDGIFVGNGPVFETVDLEPVDVWDLAPTLLHVYDQPVPSSMDGSVVQEALSFDTPVEFAEVSGAATENGEPRHDDEMREQLADLGYL